MNTRYGWIFAAGLTLTACGSATDSLGDEARQSDSDPDSQNEVYENNDDLSYDSNNAGDRGAENTGGAPLPGAVDADGVQEGENYKEWTENDWVTTNSEPTSTFSIDVDNASYTIGRDDLRNGRLPAPAGVRPEEYINFFDYDYAEPAVDMPFSINMEIAPSPFGDFHENYDRNNVDDRIVQRNGELHLLRVGLQGRHMDVADMKPTNLVFLIDTSGSMQSDRKLPLVQKSLTSLVDNLRPQDTIGIVTYAGSAGIELLPTPVSDADTIKAAIEGLSAGGSTNGADGIITAYDLAEQAKIDGGNNRVILATDGDFNVGVTGEELVDLVRDMRDQHISLTAIGYGRGNYNDADMESLARDGNGNYFYVDSLEEAQRIFGEDLPATLEVIAADVKIQIEFATDTVVRYRLVGYENRVLDNQDFEDDTKDAGEIGPGHQVTALYEVEIDSDVESADGLLAEVRLRHKSQYGEDSELQEQSIKLSQVKDDIAEATQSLRFAAAVAEFAEILRGSIHSQGARFDDVRTLAKGASANDDKRDEFVDLVNLAEGLWPAE